MSKGSGLRSGTRFLPAERGLRGTLRVPGDKSVSHRAALLGAVNDGPVTVSGFLKSADTMASLAAVQALGVDVQWQGEEVLINGGGWQGLTEPDDVIDVANSGTLIRLLPGLVASTSLFCVLTGDASIRRRPMARVLGPLASMGAVVGGRKGDTLPPVTIRGGALRGITHELPVASAQVKSCLLLAGLRARGETTLIEPAASRDHTERMLIYGGGRVEREVLPDGRGRLTVWPVEGLDMKTISVPGDFSSAAFFLAAAVLVDGSELTIENVGLNPTRTGLLDVLRRMGADVEVAPMDMLSPEPVGTLTVRSSNLTATDVGADLVPSLIDELPLYLLLAARAKGISRLRGAAELRAKESDRLQVMASFLRTLGVTVHEYPDGMDVHGCEQGWERGEMFVQGDHRMAMVGAVAGLAATEGVAVDDTDCIGVSFPSFIPVLEGVGGRWPAAENVP
ncbi:MAG: 3-phosphoshikimate 1-carboxyvinyltransferase [Thermoleophilia bacterium]